MVNNAAMTEVLKKEIDPVYRQNQRVTVLKNVRKALGKTQREICDDLKIKPSFYSDLENNRRVITDKFLKKFAYAFGVTTEYILNGGEGEMFSIFEVIEQPLYNYCPHCGQPLTTS